ncbi:MAG: hypothetical protein AAFY69_10705 [Pseudomonadota bacterium]
MSERIDDDSALQNEDGNSAWQKLSRLSQAEPDAKLRHRVLNDIHAHNTKRSWFAAFLPTRAPQWAGLAASALIGLAIGTFGSMSDPDLDTRMAQLELQLGNMNQQLLMSRLTASAPGERLAAALQAANLEQRDPAIAAALVQRAAIDTVPSIRSAAIGALGEEINDTSISMQLMAVLEESDSPIVQLAIIDLILRHGNAALLDALEQRWRAGGIHPSLSGYLEDTMGGMET